MCNVYFVYMAQLSLLFTLQS
uniref:Uncharacterized protein n=1 Tax=Arundo donax TaxID=35708 RepID=A0A0A8YHG3_ARUDO